jgi:hypothetical protein
MVLMLAAFPGIGRYTRQQIKSVIFSLSAAREREHGASLPPPCSPMRWQESAARPGPAHESAARPGPSATQRLDRARPSRDSRAQVTPQAANRANRSGPLACIGLFLLLLLIYTRQPAEQEGPRAIHIGNLKPWIWHRFC